MKGLHEEILEIPEKAELCYAKNRGIELPQSVPYLGMGSSYFAPLTLFYAGANINPQIASEYYYYLSKEIQPLGVLLSQSGESSETLWNLDRFKSVISITNNPDSSLGNSKKVGKVIQLYAGEEKFSSTKTYINTLLALYIGLGIEPAPAIKLLKKEFDDSREQTKMQADKIFQYIQSTQVKGLFIIGSGPNIGTANQGALTLTETTKLSWTAMSVAQYDHGPKEAANNTVLVILSSHGKDEKRIESLEKTVQNKSNALAIKFEMADSSEQLSPLLLIVKLNFLMDYLVDCLEVGNAFLIGEKVTRTSSP